MSTVELGRLLRIFFFPSLGRSADSDVDDSSFEDLVAGEVPCSSLSVT